MPTKNLTYITRCRKGGDIKRPRHKKPCIQERFERFRIKHPERMRQVISLAEEEHRRGATYISIDWIWTEMRRRFRVPMPNDLRRPCADYLREKKKWAVDVIPVGPRREKDS